MLTQRDFDTLNLALDVLASAKLLVLNAAHKLADLATPRSNRLEKLRGDRKGQYSIRINDQYRICFKWRDGGAHNVAIVDYH